MLPRDILHPAILESSYAPFIRSDYDASVFWAFRQLEIQVRQVSSLGREFHGAELMRRAFNKSNGVLRSENHTEKEQTALENLFVSCFGYYRNPLGHRDLEIVDPIVAIEMIIIASHLAKIVDELKPSR